MMAAALRLLAATLMATIDLTTCVSSKEQLATHRHGVVLSRGVLGEVSPASDPFPAAQGCASEEDGTFRGLRSRIHTFRERRISQP